MEKRNIPHQHHPHLSSSRMAHGSGRLQTLFRYSASKLFGIILIFFVLCNIMYFYNYMHLQQGGIIAQNNDIPRHNNEQGQILTEESGSNTSCRRIFFCRCVNGSPEQSPYTSFAQAVQKIPHLIPGSGLSSHIFTYNKDDSINSTHPSCEDEIETLLIAQRNNCQDSVPSVVEVFYHQYFEQCYKPRKIRWDIKQRGLRQNQNNSSWNGGAHLVSRNEEVPTRTIYDWGEVFNSKNVKCNGDPSALHMYRSKGLTPNQDKNCNVIHAPNIIKWALDIRKKRNEHEKINETVEEMLTHRLSYDEAKLELSRKTKFCGLVTLSTWKTIYAVDALVRHALCRLLTKKYKPCDALAAFKGALKSHPRTSPSNTYTIQMDYKFIIAMANEFSDGYLVEKTIHPYLAHSVAISGSPNLGSYINGDRPIACLIPKEPLEHAAQWIRKNGHAWMPFNTTPSDWEKDPSIQPVDFVLENDEPLLEFIAQQWEGALQPCIDEIIRLDKDEESYIAKLMEPFIKNYEHSLFDGTYVGVALLNWLVHVRSPVTFGLEEAIWKL